MCGSHPASVSVVWSTNSTNSNSICVILVCEKHIFLPQLTLVTRIFFKNRVLKVKCLFNKKEKRFFTFSVLVFSFKVFAARQSSCRFSSKYIQVDLTLPWSDIQQSLLDDWHKALQCRRSQRPHKGFPVKNTSLQSPAGAFVLINTVAQTRWGCLQNIYNLLHFDFSANSAADRPNHALCLHLSSARIDPSSQLKVHRMGLASSWEGTSVSFPDPGNYFSPGWQSPRWSLSAPWVCSCNKRSNSAGMAWNSVLGCLLS